MTDAEAKKLMDEAYAIYEKDGQWACEAFGEKHNLPFSLCEPCECETPTLTDSTGSVCLVCATSKK